MVINFMLTYIYIISSEVWNTSHIFCDCSSFSPRCMNQEIAWTCFLMISDCLRTSWSSCRTSNFLLPLLLLFSDSRELELMLKHVGDKWRSLWSYDILVFVTKQEPEQEISKWPVPLDAKPSPSTDPAAHTVSQCVCVCYKVPATKTKRCFQEHNSCQNTPLQSISHEFLWGGELSLWDTDGG